MECVFYSYDLKVYLEKTEVLGVRRPKKDAVVTLTAIKSQSLNTWDV